MISLEGKSDFTCRSEVVGSANFGYEEIVQLQSVEMKWWKLIDIRKHTSLVLILNVVRLSVQDCSSVIFANICMQRTWIRDLSFDMEKEV